MRRRFAAGSYLCSYVIPTILLGVNYSLSSAKQSSISVVARSVAWVYGRPLAEIVGSNPAGDLGVRSLSMLCDGR